MNSENIKTSSKNKKLKKRLFHDDIQKSTKTLKRHKQKESDEVDSLMFLMNTTGKNKVDELDEKLKCLKSELESLININKSNCSNNNCSSSCSKETAGSDLFEECSTQKQLSVSPSKTECHPNHDFVCKPSVMKFSELFDKVSDEEATDKTQSELLDSSGFQSNILSDKTIFLDTSTADSSFKSSFITSSPFSDNEVERLSYKSFYLQHFNVYLSSSDENEVEEVQCVTKINQSVTENRKSVRQFKKKQFREKKCNKYRPSYKRRKRRNMHQSPFETSVEVVDLMDSSSFCNNTVGGSSQECDILDLSDYDWDEPFSIDDKSESIIEILDTPEKVPPKTAKQGGSSENCKPTENNSSSLNDSCEVKHRPRWECPICFEPSRGQAVVATQCGHVFCKKCLDTHTSTFSKNCPTCRADLSKTQPISLFNF